MSQSEVSVLLVGKSGAGKSALFLNLLGRRVDVDDDLPITETFEIGTVKQEGVTIHLIDSPGLMNKLKTSSEKEKKKFDLFIFCIRIDPGTKFHEVNPEVIQLLSSLGIGIWNRCIVVFTFSNQVLRHTGSSNNDAYTNYIDNCLEVFKDALKGETTISATTVWNASGMSHNGILAIPAGFNPEDQVLPSNKPNDSHTWVQEILREITTKSQSHSEPPIEISQLGKTKKIYKKILKQAGVGCVVGGIVGGPLGAIGGVVATVAGVIIGAGAGAITVPLLSKAFETFKK